MPASDSQHNFVSNRLHLVIRIRRGLPSIPDDLQDRVWGYIGGVAKHAGLFLYQVNGVSNHAHIFVGLPASIALSDAVHRIKANSAGWLRQQPRMGRFEWQDGYGAFSVSASHTDATVAYIRRQREHHAKRDFKFEMEYLLRRYGLVPTALGTWIEE